MLLYFIDCALTEYGLSFINDALNFNFNNLISIFNTIKKLEALYVYIVLRRYKHV